MSTPPDTPATPGPRTFRDGFDVLDVCHRHSLFALGKLAALITRLEHHSPEAPERQLAQEVLAHFGTTVRTHHEDEERHVFPALLARGDAELCQAVQRLQQDHHWLDENWHEIAPHLQAVVQQQSWYDIALLREASEVFSALMHDHMALEESYIYPQLRRKLPLAERQAMGREMARRRREAAAQPPERLRGNPP